MSDAELKEFIGSACSNPSCRGIMFLRWDYLQCSNCDSKFKTVRSYVKALGNNAYRHTPIDGCSLPSVELKSEMDELVEALGVTDEWRVENIKETAMNRHTPKKSRRPFIKRILDEAFKLLKEEVDK